MADRFLLKQFARNATNNGVFGSFESGNPTTTQDVNDIQSLQAYLQGWLNATDSARALPRLEEMQGLQYLWCKAIIENYREGVPQWIAGETYYAYESIVCVPNANGFPDFYLNITGTNGTTSPATDTTNWLKIPFTYNPMTASGDIIVGGANGTPTRLGIGNQGQVLGVSGENLQFIDFPSSVSPLFCANSGNVNASGQANIVNVSGNTLQFNVGGNYPSLILTLANGSSISRDSIPSIDLTSVANGQYGIYIGVSGDAIIIPTGNLFIQRVQPDPLSGVIWLDVSTYPYRSTRYNGTSWEEFNYAPLPCTLTIAGSSKTITNGQYNVRYVNDTITDKDKSDILSWIPIQPKLDWNRRVSKPTEGSFTLGANENGALICHCRGNGGWAINGITFVLSSNSEDAGWGFMLVKGGDVISRQSSGGYDVGMLFVPFAGS